MTRSQFAHGRSQLPFSSSNLAVTSGGTTTTSRTLYFCIQGENPAGLNLPSAIAGPVTINAGQQLTIAIPATARETGEWWPAFVVSTSTSNVASTFTQIAKLDGYTPGGDLTALPATITLSSDAHFALSASVATSAALPATPVNGMCRGVNDLGFVYEYSQVSNLPADNLTVLSATVGRWLRIGSFSTAITSTTDPGGCAQDIRSINESAVRSPLYAADGSTGAATRFWINNDLSSAEAQGKRVGVVVEFNGETKTQLFNGLLKLTFRGYANTATGILRTTDGDSVPLSGIDEVVPFRARKTSLILPDDLQPGEAYVLDISPNFTPSDLGNQLPDKALLKVFPFLYAQSGDYSEFGAITGDLIYPEGDKRLIVPDNGLSVQALSGSGIVDSFSFLSVGATVVTGLSPNTANQTISINGNGAVKKASPPLPITEATRALVGTLDGVGAPSNYSTVVSVTTGNQLTVTCGYPTAIRADYPDTRIAGSTKGKFNATDVILYVKRISDGQIRSFVGYSIVSGASQQFTITNWAAGSVITSLPTPTDISFGLFAPGSVSAIAGSGATDFTSGNYQVAFAFGFTNTVTSITHEPSAGCIKDYVIAPSGEPVADPVALRAITPSDRSPYHRRFIISLRRPATFDPTSFAKEAGNGVYKPNDLSDDSAGRWIVDCFDLEV